ncbi:hypothetical protein DICVIV_01655 [Dictyocaulus viviparus]|uniref:Uncharacterized protein n=1 Tax=Dictyocaulus viviparus TaxID=29172 RepID=A0A0D8Y654_DICVI|nr:hypothetical protein DICVIV_01655 [Dictyocaulus viviparus]
MELKVNRNRHVYEVLCEHNLLLKILNEDSIEYPKTGNPVSLRNVVVRENSIVMIFDCEIKQFSSNTTIENNNIRIITFDCEIKQFSSKTTIENNNIRIITTDLHQMASEKSEAVSEIDQYNGCEKSAFITSLFIISTNNCSKTSLGKIECMRNSTPYGKEQNASEQK